MVDKIELNQMLYMYVLIKDDFDWPSENENIFWSNS